MLLSTRVASGIKYLARAVSGLGALLVIVAPFTTFALVPISNYRLPLPGILFSGWSLILGGVGALLVAVGARRCLSLYLPLEGFMLWALHQDYQYITVRIQYLLRKLQLSLSTVNQALSQTGFTPIELVPPRMPAETFLGAGLEWALGGCLLVALGGIIELIAHMLSGGQLGAIALGLNPRCSCGMALEANMRFCPGCGKSIADVPRCAYCGEQQKNNYFFCPQCGKCQAKR